MRIHILIQCGRLAGWAAALMSAGAVESFGVPDPDAGLVLACEQARHRVILLDATQPWSAEGDGPVWAWSAEHDPAIPVDAKAWFRHPSDAKRVTRLASGPGLGGGTCASGGGVAADPQPRRQRLTDLPAPAWFHHAIWYQIFPDRFHNGDPHNDPTVDTLQGTWPYRQPVGWAVSPWTSDWYAPQAWEARNDPDFYVNAQLRRYGGDLQGIMDKLDYLEALGVDALYLNPIFESASLHKYGATFYHHVDNNFGPDPESDARLWAEEDPADPATWQWSAADRLFLELLQRCHRRGIRVIIDGVFNHVGIPFWAFQRAREEGPDSPYAQWFRIHSWPNPDVPGSAFRYEGWAGVQDLPVFRQDGAGPAAPVRQHLRAVVRRWMDPNGDGNPEDGIDGWRLDVAAELPLAFWRTFRTWVHEINPNAFLTGEVWWEDYGSMKMMDASPWLAGDAFDSVMNYRFGDALLRLVNPSPTRITPSAYAGLINDLHGQYGFDVALGVQNYLGSHDTARVASALVNPQYRLDHGANPKQNRSYRVRAPNRDERLRQKLAAAIHILSPGAPAVYYGDEAGLWGADDPDCRKPMLWPELAYQPETHDPFGVTGRRDVVRHDHALRAYYAALIDLRRRIPAFSAGRYRVLLADDERWLLAFERALGDRHVAMICNVSDAPQPVAEPELAAGEGLHWERLALPQVLEEGACSRVNGSWVLAPWHFVLFEATTNGRAGP